MPALARPCVCLITDRRRVAPAARTARDEIVALERWLDEAIGLVDLIQIRERDLSDADLHGLVRRVASRARGTSSRLLVNDRADVALAAGADGVHLRADGVPPARVRDVARPGWILGRSTHAPGETGDPALDYVLFGSVFSAAVKAGGTHPARGLAGLSTAVTASPCAVLAIGGVTIANAADCARAGAAGVAAIGAFVTTGIRATADGMRAAFYC